MQFPKDLTPRSDTRAGRMLEAGDVRVTLLGVDSSQPESHITIRFKCIFDNRPTEIHRPRPDENRNWLRVPFSEATHVFVEVPSAEGEYADKVGTFYPRSSKYFADKNADPQREQAAKIAAAWLKEPDSVSHLVGDPDEGGIILREELNCGRCGRRLTDPVSIERGIGPECYGLLTGSQHQVKQKGFANAQLRMPLKQSTLVSAALETWSQMNEDERREFLTSIGRQDV